MTKWLVLSLVLGVASMAPAAMTISAPPTAVEGTQFDVIVSGGAGEAYIAGLYEPSYAPIGIPDNVLVLDAAGNLGTYNIFPSYGGFDFTIDDLLGAGVQAGDWIIATYTAGTAGNSLVLDLYDYVVNNGVEPVIPSVAIIAFVDDIVYPDPYFYISSQSFSFSAYVEGTNPNNQSMTIRNGGEQTLNWSVSEPNLLPDWLTVAPSSGSLVYDQNEVVTVSADITGLAAGLYSYAFEVADPNAMNSPQSITVDLEVIGPILEVPEVHSNFDFTAYLDGANPNDRTMSVYNAGGGTLYWSIDATDMPSWLTISPTTGSLGHNVSEDVVLSVDISGHAGGLYSYVFEVADPIAQNSPQTITVDLEVIGPILDVSNTGFNFATDLGGPDPIDQILTILNSGGGTLNWSADTTGVPSWLAISSTSGSLGNGQSDPITLSASVAGLSEGIYSYTFDVAAPNADGSPDTLEVELNYGNICYTGPDYAEWVAVGRPDSWCSANQSRGDADGSNEMIGKSSYTVGFNDLDILLEGFYKPYSGDPIIDPWIAADFDHASERIGKEFYRVGFNDLNIWLSNFQMPISP